MNEFNREQQNDQVSASENEVKTPKQENIYTVGGGYGQQTVSPTPETEQQTTDGQDAQNTQPPQTVYTAPSGNSYSYSSNIPPHGQPGGYYSSQMPPRQQEKKKSKAGLVAIAIVGCLLLSLLMGIGGASLTWIVMSGEEDIRQDVIDELPQNTPDIQAGQQGATDSQGGEASDQTDTQTPSEVVIKKDNGTKVVVTSGNIGDEDLSYADVVALVENSVVEITTNYVVSGSMFSQYVSSGAGSGVIISQSGNVGYIVTNNHVIQGATSIVVRLKDGTELPAELIGSDSATDLAVLTVKTEQQLTVATLVNDSDSLVVGQEVLAIGNPLGQLGGTVTNGIVSALEREVEIDGEKMTLLQTNAAVNPGNSGGGLFDMYGRLIGVVNAKSSGDDVEGLGFAIPANTVHEITAELIMYGYVRNRPALGITVSVARQQYFMQVVSYIYVTDPGETALQVNDILYSIEGTEITSSDVIASAISGKAVGDKVEIVVLRNNTQVTVEVVLIEYVPEGAR